MNFLLLIIIELFLGVYFFFNFMLISIYIFSSFYENYKKVLVYWLDFWIINIFIMSFILALLITLANSTTPIEDLGSLVYSFVEFHYLLINIISAQNLVQNLIKSCFVCLKSEKNIKTEGDNIVFNKKIHFILITLQWIVNLVFIWAYYSNELYEIIDDEDFLRQIFILVFILLTVFSIIFVFILNWKKSKIENFYKKKNILNSNFEENSQITKVIESIRIGIDYLIYKIIIDIVLNIPMILILSIYKITTTIILIHQLILIIFTIFQANLQLRVDRISFKLKDSVKIFFCVKHFNLKLGGSYVNKCKTLRKRKRTNLNNIEEEINSATSQSNVMNLNSLLISSSHLEIHEGENSEKIFYSKNEYLPVNFFIIFKLVSNYFKINQQMFTNIEKKFKEIEENQKINCDLKKSFLSRISHNKSENFAIQSMSQISNVISDTKFIYNFCLKLNQIFTSTDDNDLKDQFEKILSNTKKLNTSKLNFQVESLFEENLKELFPFYQICCKDILNSVDPEKNKSLCRNLFEKKYIDNSFNNYYTFDTFISFEIYDKESALDTLQNFIPSYSTYIKTKIKNWEQTCLPLIISVFSIKYLDYDKIIILCRHPLSFSPFVSFKFWMNVCFLETEEKISYSSNHTEIIDIKEIEIKDNILMHKDDHSELTKMLKKDFKFLKKLSFCSNYLLNVFIVNDLKNFLSTFGIKRTTLMNDLDVTVEKRNKKDINAFNAVRQDKNDMLEVNDFNSVNETDKSKSNMFPHDLLSVIRVTNAFRDNVTGKNGLDSNKENGSDVVCQLEKIITNYVVNNRYLIKIFFSGIFNGSDSRESLTRTPEVFNKIHCEILKTQILKILKSQDDCEEKDVPEIFEKFENVENADDEREKQIDS